jgi:hypothetical protein
VWLRVLPCQGEGRDLVRQPGRITFPAPSASSFNFLSLCIVDALATCWASFFACLALGSIARLEKSRLRPNVLPSLLILLTGHVHGRTGIVDPWPYQSVWQRLSGAQRY